MSSTDDEARSGRTASPGERYLEAAAEAARRADPEGMLEGLAASGFLDGLARRLQAKWPRLPAPDVDGAVAEAIGVYYSKSSAGEPILRPAPYMYKTADRMALDRHRSLERLDYVEPAVLAEAEAKPQGGGDRERPDNEEAIRDEALRLARSFLPQLGQQNIRAVMAYYLDAIEAGAEDITDHEVGEALGLKPATVKTLRWRGFKRLERVARREGLWDSNLALPGLDQDEKE